MWKYLFNKAPMFVFLTTISIVIGVMYNWTLLVEILTSEDASNHWMIIIFDLICFAVEAAKIAFYFVIVLNLTYYGIKSIFRPFRYS